MRLLLVAAIALLVARSDALAMLPTMRISPRIVVRCKVARCVKAGEALPQESDADATTIDSSTNEVSVLGQAGEAAGAVYRFSRPHTIRGTLLACFTGVARALIESPIYLSLLPALLPRAMFGVLALLLGCFFVKPRWRVVLLPRIASAESPRNQK